LQPIANLAAEEDLLGAILLDNRAALKINDFLRPHHFTEPANSRTFEILQQLILEGKTADPVTLVDCHATLQAL